MPENDDEYDYCLCVKCKRFNSRRGRWVTKQTIRNHKNASKPPRKTSKKKPLSPRTIKHALAHGQEERRHVQSFSLVDRHPVSVSNASSSAENITSEHPDWEGIGGDVNMEWDGIDTSESLASELYAVGGELNRATEVGDDVQTLELVDVNFGDGGLDSENDVEVGNPGPCDSDWMDDATGPGVASPTQAESPAEESNETESREVSTDNTEADCGIPDSVEDELEVPFDDIIPPPPPLPSSPMQTHTAPTLSNSDHRVHATDSPIDKIRILSMFIKALEEVEWDNIEAPIAHQLQNPVEEAPSLDDPDHIFCIETYLSTQSTLQKTYERVINSYQKCC
jgi:hypothetical protein